MCIEDCTKRLYENHYQILRDLARSLFSDVNIIIAVIAQTATSPAMPSLRPAAFPANKLPNIFWMTTLEARNSVMRTEMSRVRLAQPGCGLLDMN